jgi:spermidine/putrescine transport system permease protein
MKPVTRRALFAGVVLFVYAPILVVAVYSFNDSRFALAWQGFRLRWYKSLLASPEFRMALENSLVISLSSTLLATVLGTLLAIGMHFLRFPGRRLLQAVLYLPVVMPDIVMAVGLLSLYVALHVTLGRLSVILAHVSFQISFVALVVGGRLGGFPLSVVEAARDLGARPAAVLRRVILPLILPGVLAGAVVALTLSVDDFLITYFTAGAGASTLPIRIYAMVKRGVTPDVNALATLLLVFTIGVSLLALRGLRTGSAARGAVAERGEAA